MKSIANCRHKLSVEQIECYRLSLILKTQVWRALPEAAWSSLFGEERSVRVDEMCGLGGDCEDCVAAGC